MGILSMDMMNYLKSAAKTFGANASVDSVFQEIILKK